MHCKFSHLINTFRNCHFRRKSPIGTHRFIFLPILQRQIVALKELAIKAGVKEEDIENCTPRNYFSLLRFLYLRLV